MFLVSRWSCFCSIHWSQVLSREWRRSWSSADRRCSNYIWVIKIFIAYWGVTYIRDLTVYILHSNLNKWWLNKKHFQQNEFGINWNICNMAAILLRPQEVPASSKWSLFPGAFFYEHGLTLIPAWISNYMPGIVWGEITYPFLNFNGATVEV